MESGGPKRILIVDDSEDMRDAFQALFESVGYAVSTAENGQAGLGAARSFQPDVVIVDAAMPVMDGLEFLHHLRSDFAPPLPPVIVCSGFSSAEQPARDGGAYAFVLKPVAASVLLELVSRAIDQRSSDPALLSLRREPTEPPPPTPIAPDVALGDGLETLTGSMRESLEFARAYFDTDEAFAAVFREGTLTVVGSRGPVRRSAQPSTSIGEIILSGSTLVLSDVTKHASFARDLAELPRTRSLVGVPVVTPAGATIGAVLLTREQVLPFEQEDVLILRSIVTRAARVIERVSAGEADPFRDFPFLQTAAAIARDAFQLVVDMEVRLAARAREPVELAFVDAAAPITAAAIRAVQHAVEPCRWATGAMGPRRLAFFKRGADVGDVHHEIDAAAEALRSVVPLSGVGSVCVDGCVTGVVDASMLLQLAERTLATCSGSGRLERLLLGPAPTSSASRARSATTESARGDRSSRPSRPRPPAGH
jgi:CheY-like chemotaxis protein